MKEMCSRHRFLKNSSWIYADQRVCSSEVSRICDPCSFWLVIKLMEEENTFALGEIIVSFMYSRGLSHDLVMFLKEVSAKDIWKCQLDILSSYSNPFTYTFPLLPRLNSSKFGKTRFCTFYSLPPHTCIHLHQLVSILKCNIQIQYGFCGCIIPSYGNILDVLCIIFYNFPQTSAWQTSVFALNVCRFVLGCAEFTVADPPAG